MPTDSQPAGKPVEADARSKIPEVGEEQVSTDVKVTAPEQLSFAGGPVTVIEKSAPLAILPVPKE